MEDLDFLSFPSIGVEKNQIKSNKMQTYTFKIQLDILSHISFLDLSSTSWSMKE